MNTYIAMQPNKGKQFFSTNNTTNEFEMRFWQSVAKLQVKGQWLCLVSPFQLPPKQLLIAAGIKVDRMLVVYTQSNQQALTSSIKALKHGKCSAVISWISTLSNQDQFALSQAANNGNTVSVIVKSQADKCINNRQAA